jgi:hypothetical protein
VDAFRFQQLQMAKLRRGASFHRLDSQACHSGSFGPHCVLLLWLNKKPLARGLAAVVILV